jgi:hypothetical protein
VGQTFTVTAQFSENMDNTVYPTISFTPDVTADTLTYSENWWSTDNTTYYENYTIADAGVVYSGVDVSVSGGRDLANNLQSPDPTTTDNLFDVDTLNPAPPSLTSPADGEVISDSTPTLDWDAVSGAATYNLEVDDASDFSSPNISQTGLTQTDYTTPSLDDGLWYWRVRAVDAAGNAGGWSSRSFRVDTATPVVGMSEAIIAIGAVPWGADWKLETTNAILTISGTVEDVTSVVVTINGEPVSVEAGRFSQLVTLLPGTHSYEIVVMDDAGNTTTTTLWVTYTPPEEVPEVVPPVEPAKWPLLVGALIFLAVVVVLVLYVFTRKK